MHVALTSEVRQWHAMRCGSIAAVPRGKCPGGQTYQGERTREPKGVNLIILNPAVARGSRVQLL